MPDRLVCQGDGESISDDGWLRLAYVMGAGDQVEEKKLRIGVKNHGLKACFRLGNEIILRSDGRKMIQTLYKDGYASHPSPGTLPEPLPDHEAPPTGCAVEVPYRQRRLVVIKGEALTLEAPDQQFLEALFRNACDHLARRLLGVVRPGIRDEYTLRLSHHALGAVELHWQAKRGRNINGRGRRRFLMFGRECNTASEVSDIPSSTIYEQACTFRIPFPTGKRPEIPDFFVRDKHSFLAEIAWLTSKSGTPKSTVGVRRYPIGYEGTSESALTGAGVHYSAPFISDAERHGVSQMDIRNSYIDDACKDALVEIMGSHLLHRHGAKAMELYMADPGNPRDDLLSDLTRRTLDRRALPIRDKALRATRRSKRLVLGPRRRSSDALRRIVLPMYTWDRQSVSPHLSKLCPSDEDQIDSSVPSAILLCLSEDRFSSNLASGGSIITFDENDAIQRLQPRLKADYFPWKDESEWQAALGNPLVSSIYLEVAYETIRRGDVESESDVRQNTYLPDERSMAQPLAELFSAVRLPPSLGARERVPILHPELRGHRLLRRAEWKPKPFTLDDYLDRTELTTASLADRESFWNWLRGNGRSVKRRTLMRISTLPVWPGSNGCLLTLHDLCEPHNPRVSFVMGEAIVRPSSQLLRAGLVGKTGRSRLTFRNVPTRDECERMLSRRIGAFPRQRKFTPDEQNEFHKLEKDLATLVTSTPRLREYLGELSEKYGAALGKDRNARLPLELVRDDPVHQGLCLLDRHVIDRPEGILDGINGWAPKIRPSTDQIIDTLREDGVRHDAHVPRLSEYVKEAYREGILPIGLTELPCIPVDGELRSPDQIALRGRRNFWGDWKIEIAVADVNPEVQRLYRSVGVVGGAPDPTNSRHFFQWLASREADILVQHTDQILRHISHRLGPYTWSDEFSGVPFIPVESDGGNVRLVTKAETNRNTRKVVIPDFEELEEVIRQHTGNWPVEMAIVESRRVSEPITAHLREFGLRTLSDYAGEPLQVIGTERVIPVPNIDFKRILDSFQSGLKGKQLQKRLSKLGLETTEHPLRGNWRHRLSSVQAVEIAASVSATYRLGRRSLSVSVDGKLDRESGTLWIRSDADLRSVFFDVIADHIFEEPKKYYGSVLDRAYEMELRERNRKGREDEGELPADDDIDGVTNQEGLSRSPWGTSGVHSIPNGKSVSNLPDPGPIPLDDGTITSANRNTRRTSRTHSVDENAQIDDLKKNQYAWHCQACIAGMEPKELAPSSSYVARSENRSQIMHGHHCDHLSAGGARHAGNIVLLCRYHHLDLGDAITRSDITRAFDRADDRRLTFKSDNGLSKSLQGRVVTVHAPQRQNPVSLFFTKEHAAYWLRRATGEDLI